MTKMTACYNEDIDLYKRKQPAVKKFLFLTELTKELKNVRSPPSRNTPANAS